MSHPLHGTRPLDTSAGFPEAAAQISARWSEVADRGIIAAVEFNPELRDRVGDLGLRHLLRDAEVVLQKLCESVGAGSVAPLSITLIAAVPTTRCSWSMGLGIACWEGIWLEQHALRRRHGRGSAPTG